MRNSEITDELLYQYVPIVDRALLDGLPMRTEHVFSRRFERRMRKLLSRERHSTFYNQTVAIGKWAAIVLAAILIMGMTITLSVEAFRDRFFQIMKSYDAEGKGWDLQFNMTEEDDNFYYKKPEYIPKGFELVEEYVGEIHWDQMYEDGKGGFILVSNDLIQGTRTESMDAEYDEETILVINGHEATIHIRNEAYIDLFWCEKNMKYDVYTSPDVPVEEVIKIAEEMK